MTPTPTQKGMTDQEMRIAIAEACGFQRSPEHDWNTMTFDHKTTRHEAYKKTDGFVLGVWSMEELPDYPNDLNACREMFLSLSEVEQQTFGIELVTIVLDGQDPEDPIDNIQLSELVNAKPRQRCIAFLRTIGKWKE